MIVVIDMIPYKVLEIIERNTDCDHRIDYLCTNGKYKIMFSKEEFKRGKSFI